MRGSSRQSGLDEDEGERLKILAFPDYRDVNPYQQKLEAGLRDRGVSISTVDSGGRWFPVLEAVRQHGTPDVFHAHFFDHMMIVPSISPPYRSLVSALLGLRLVFELLVLRIAGVSLVWTAHDLVNHERHAVRVELAFKHVLVRFLCDAVIIHCSGAADVILDTYRLPERVRRKMTVVPHGHFIDDYPNEVTADEARSRLDLDDDTIFLFFGWIRRYKNVPLLVETFADLDADDARLLVAGNPRTDALAEEVSRAVEATSHAHARLEFVPDEEVQLYMNAADVVVVPFRTERQTMLTSGSVLLAMSFGKAVIAPRLGCVEDLVDRKGGFAYDSSDRSALLSSMRAALRADLDGMGQYNYQKVKQYEWDQIADVTLDVYRAVS